MTRFLQGGGGGAIIDWTNGWCNTQKLDLQWHAIDVNERTGGDADV